MGFYDVGDCRVCNCRKGNFGLRADQLVIGIDDRPDTVVDVAINHLLTQRLHSWRTSSFVTGKQID